MYAVLLITLLFHASCQAEDVLQVSVYYESLCPDSIRFITKQLYPAYSKIGSSLSLDFVPYGKANQEQVNGQWQFRCQHGPSECLGNKYQACGLDQNRTQTENLEFVNCVMGASNPSSESTIATCVPKLGVQSSEIIDCANSARGSEILARLGDQTHAVNPSIYFIPTITFNGSYDFDVHWGSISDFLATACKALNNKPAGCQ